MRTSLRKKGAPKRALFSFITSVSPPAVRIRSRGSSLNLGESVETALPAGNFVVLLGSLFVAERKHVARTCVRIEGLRQCRRRHDTGGECNNRNELLHGLSPGLCWPAPFCGCAASVCRMQIGWGSGGTTKLPYRKLNSISPERIGERTRSHRPRSSKTLNSVQPDERARRRQLHSRHLKGRWILTANLVA